jgi:hypothetical protein
MLHDRELAGVRALFERLGGSGACSTTACVSPSCPADSTRWQRARERYDPVGWKVYTLGAPVQGWFLDDEATGVPFLEQVRASGVRRVCAHKGISNLVPTGSPRDVGPAAAAFPDLDFLIYHSGYEIPPARARGGPLLRRDRARRHEPARDVAARRAASRRARTSTPSSARPGSA